MAKKYSFTVSGAEMVEKVKEVIREGNVTRIRLVHEGKPLIDIPLSVGAPAVAATVLAAPVLAAMGAMAALLTRCTIEIEREEDKDQQ